MPEICPEQRILGTICRAGLREELALGGWRRTDKGRTIVGDPKALRRPVAKIRDRGIELLLLSSDMARKFEDTKRKVSYNFYLHKVGGTQ